MAIFNSNQQLRSTNNVMKVVCTLLMLSTLVTFSSGSAIPIWEYLSRSEKMSHLYSMFAKQVSAHCKSNLNDQPVAVCKRDLLVYGIGKLELMSDTYLDSMDPYQRGVNDIIWDSMVEGHASVSPKRQRTTPTPIRQPVGQYEHNPLFNDRSDSSPNSDKLNEASSLSSAYAMDMDNSYGQNYPTAVENQYASIEPQHNQLNHEATNVQLSFEYPRRNQINYNTKPENHHLSYPSGPMVIRVRPDGTPVAEDQRVALPRDDDREAMTIGKEKLPTIAQITREFSSEATVPSASGQQQQTPYIYKSSNSYRTTY